MLITLSPLHPQHTHPHTPYQLVIPQGHGHAGARSISLCVMLSLSYSVISFSVSPLSQKECVSCRSTSQCQEAK